MLILRCSIYELKASRDTKFLIFCEILCGFFPPNFTLELSFQVGMVVGILTPSVFIGLLFWKFMQ